MADLQVNLAGVTLANPLIAASGTFGFGREYGELYPLSTLGGISCKGLTLRERPGNPPPRIAETPGGMLNAVGLQNPGVESFIAHELPWLRQQGTVIIANIAGNTPEEYREMAERLSETDVDMIEMNISCPNVKQGGVQFGTHVRGRHGRDQRGAPLVQKAAHGEALPERFRHRGDGRGRRGRRGGRRLAHQHAHRHAHRHPHPPAHHSQQHRRAERPGRVPRGRAHGVAGRAAREDPRGGPGRHFPPGRTPWRCCWPAPRRCRSAPSCSRTPMPR